MAVYFGNLCRNAVDVKGEGESAGESGRAGFFTFLPALPVTSSIRRRGTSPIPNDTRLTLFRTPPRGRCPNLRRARRWSAPGRGRNLRLGKDR